MSKEQTTKVSLAEFKKIYSRIFSYALKYKWTLFVSIFSLVILALTNTGFLALIKKITDEGFVEQASNSIFLSIALVILMTIRALSGFVSGYSMRWVSRKIVEDLRFDAFKKLMVLPITYFDSNASGNIVSKLTYETEQLSFIATKVALESIRESLTIIGIVSYMIYLDWVLTFIFALMAPLMAFYLRLVSPKLRKAGSEVQTTMGDMTSASEEAISGQRIVKIFESSLFEFKKFAEIVIRNRKMQTKLAQLSGTNGFVIEVLASISLALVVYYSVGRFTPGEFAAFVGALLMLISPIKKLTAINEQIQIGIAAAKSIFSVMDEKKEIDVGKKTLKKIYGHIEFRKVSFSYEKIKKSVLKNINLIIKPGEKIALVGKSGGGKTSLINLIPRFYDLESGSILIDNTDINQIKLSDLRHHLSLVSQDTILFNDTIYNNIAYGSLNKVNSQKVRKAAKAANAIEFIDKLPDGFNHKIGGRGVRLSGGQKQRIAIARAILKNAPILLLDEATSALDSESEKFVQEALDNLMKGRTTIVIAHRLSTIINADRIVVIDNGEIVEIGTHQSLLKSKKHYFRLYKKGFS
ncbi:lipid A export permease/ATP-binding protein MsbA [Methylophilaceae bacterium]|nr:lipid A export permease/ATP-binding protein MsbA [Methylophilaceae bacterium]|tara:strand:- start:3543 stop:5285 length:1743 start_codon:yes stop_codon:yes gene_type:complete